MKIFRRFVAALIFASVVLAAVVCSAEGIRIGGVPVDEAMYNLAYFNANYAATVAGAPTDREALHAQALLGCARIIAIEQASAERGVALDENGEAYVDDLIEEYWPQIRDKYEKSVISKETWRRYLVSCSLETELFDALYGAGGELAWDDAALKAQYEKRFARIEYICIPLREMREGGMSDAEIQEIAQCGADLLSDNADTEDALGAVKGKMNPAYAERSYRTAVWVDTDGDATGTYSDEFLELLRNSDPGACGLYDTTVSTLIYRVLGELGTQAEFEAMRAEIVRTLCYPEYEDYIAEIIAGYEVVGA